MATSRWIIATILLLMATAFVVAEDRATVRDASGDFNAQLAALAKIRTLQAHYTCRKKIPGIDDEFVHSGTIWIRAGRSKAGTQFVGPGGGGVHMHAEAPFRSDTILEDGKNMGRTQHETKCSVDPQPSKPGLTALTGQIAGLCVGHPGKLAEWFTVEEANEQTFQLWPATDELRRILKRMTVVFDGPTHRIISAEIITPQDDQIRYEFSDIQIDNVLPAEAFHVESR